MHSTFEKIVAGAVIAVLGGAVGCKKSQQAGPTAPPPPVVEVAAAETKDVPLYLDEIGKVAALESVSVMPRIAGQIVACKIGDGATVKKGDVLFEIDPAPTQAVLAAAQAQVAQAKAAADFARIELERYSAVAGTRAISKSDYDTKKNAVDVAEAQQKSAEANVRTAQINLDFCTIRAPIDGRAGEVLIDPGNVVKENETALLSVQRLDPVYADFTVSEQNLASVRANMADGTLKAYARLPADPAGPGKEGSLTFLDNAVQDGMGTVKLRATIENMDLHFWPGQFVNVRLVLKTLKGAVLVPSNASLMSQKGPYVFVVKSDNTAEMRMVKVGQAQGDKLVISEGLAAGEKVITDGQMMVMPGGPIRLPGPPPQAPAEAAKGEAGKAGSEGSKS